MSRGRRERSNENLKLPVNKGPVRRGRGAKRPRRAQPVYVQVVYVSQKGAQKTGTKNVLKVWASPDARLIAARVCFPFWLVFGSFGGAAGCVTGEMNSGNPWDPGAAGGGNGNWRIGDLAW